MTQPDVGTTLHYRADDANTGTHPTPYGTNGDTSRCQAAIVTGHNGDEAISLMVASDHGWQEHRYVYPNTNTTGTWDLGRWHGPRDHYH
jgi:hypothetical protein